MALNNQLATADCTWTGMVFTSLPRGSGVVFEEVTIDKRVGPEAVALLIDPETDELLAKTNMNLNLKAGIAATAYGPVLFLIWWIPPIVNGRPSAFYEQVMNPLHSKTVRALRRLTNQTHLHVLLVNVSGQVLKIFEYENIFGFDKILAGVDAARVAWPSFDGFIRAKEAYEQEYTIDELLATT